MTHAFVVPLSVTDATRRFGVLIAVALAFLIGCGGTEGPSVALMPGPPAAATSGPPPAAMVGSVVASPVLTGSAAVPPELVGDWSSAEGNAEIVYRFLADGRFRSAQILNQPRPAGVFEFRVVQEGMVEVGDNQLVLRPTASLKSLTDPDEPQRSYSDQAASLEEESYAWRVTGSTLFLRGTDGLELSFARQ